MYRIKRYFQGVWKQAKKVRWPKKKELMQAVGVVLVVIAFAAVCLMIDDLLVSKLLQGLDDAFPSDTETSSSAMRIIGGFLKF